jgi:hypothetical protein
MTLISDFSERKDVEEHLLENKQDLKIGVVVNDVGINIDAKMIGPDQAWGTENGAPAAPDELFRR